MGRFTIIKTSISKLMVVEHRVICDHRGQLKRLFCRESLLSVIGDRPIVQINHTLTSKKGTVRGMHFQYPPYAEMKLVTCLRGEIYDVAVDLRQGSPTRLQWCAQLLSEDNHRTFAIPEGFAHGFQALTDSCELIYLHTSAYQPDAEGAVNALDPLLNIEWPLPITDLSERDQSHSLIDNNFIGIEL